jgi:Leucine-rich repeat (LRR) protein
MKNNQISGFLPSKMEFPKASAIDLSSNQLSGTIPKLPVYLTSLDLSRNNFTGPLPLDFGAPGLTTLLLYKNSISGTIPSSLCKLRLLTLLDLSDNKLTGSLPDCLEDKSTINMTSLSIQSLNLKNNSLSGEFPLFLRNCQQLIYLDLSQNLFSGILPVWIEEDLPFLSFLRLRYNMFYGCIPVELAILVKLQYLDLAYNNFTGSIPKSLVRCTGMRVIPDKAGEFENIIHSAYSVDAYQMTEYKEASTIVTKGQEKLYTGEIIYMVNLDLSCNNFFGEIPTEIGTLVALKNLNLSWNGFRASSFPRDSIRTEMTNTIEKSI